MLLKFPVAAKDTEAPEANVEDVDADIKTVGSQTIVSEDPALFCKIFWVSTIVVEFGTEEITLPLPMAEGFVVSRHCSPGI